MADIANPQKTGRSLQVRNEAISTSLARARPARRGFTDFRSRFVGKCSPIDFFWGSFDLAMTRFSGRRAPMKPDADLITREAYSHEVSSIGVWPGDGVRLKQASFYAYAAPEPAGLREAPVTPPMNYYNQPLGGFYLHYADFRTLPDPAKSLLDYCQSTYEAARMRVTGTAQSSGVRKGVRDAGNLQSK